MFFLNQSIYLKKTHHNPLGSFKYLSIHRDNQQEASFFYTYYVMIMKPD
jgi:hypothetical protein